jgi:hypothetical protein
MPARSSRTPSSSARLLAAAATGAVLVLALAACGGDSSTGAPAAGQRGAGAGRFAADPTVRACLKTHGVAQPAGGARVRPPGGPRITTNGQPQPQQPTTTAPGRRRQARRDPAQFAKLRAALKACGVQPPTGRPGGPPAGAPPAPTQTAPSAATS